MDYSDSTTYSNYSEEEAIRKAESYLRYIDAGYSEQKLVGQLEYEGFSEDTAQKAVRSLNIDWNEQAVKSAKYWSKQEGYNNRKELLDMLENGRYFTREQAEYGVNAIGY